MVAQLECGCFTIARVSGYALLARTYKYLAAILLVNYKGTVNIEMTPASQRISDGLFQVKTRFRYDNH